MLAGPPRLVTFISVLVLIILGWSYTRLSHTPSSRRINFTVAKNHTQGGPVAGSASRGDPLDFSIPLRFADGAAKPPGSNHSYIIVIPKTKDEDLSWLTEEIPDASLAVYEVDNPNAQYKVPKNKGREAMVYLTYMIDHYDSLPDTTIFMHAHRVAWHNNLLMGQDAAPMLKRLNHDRVARLGYMNVRCHHEPGCPDWIHMDRPGGDFDFFRKPEEIHWRRSIWEEIHPGAPIPPSLSSICCAQFAVSRDRIRQVPIERLLHYRRWLMNTSMEDQYSGRVFEYIWHYIFTGHEVYCPAQNTCYCDGYGICFGGRQKYEDYWDRQKERDKHFEEFDKFNKQSEEAKKNGEEKTFTQKEQDRIEELKKLVSEADDWLGKERDRAYERGEDPKARAEETEGWDSEHIWDYSPGGSKFSDS